jgi:hypothetical protein
MCVHVFPSGQVVLGAPVTAQVAAWDERALGSSAGAMCTEAMGADVDAKGIGVVALRPM